MYVARVLPSWGCVPINGSLASLPPPPLSQARVNDAHDVVIRAFAPLPHTGLPLEVKGVTAGAEL
jgi:hypothetical protein